MVPISAAIGTTSGENKSARDQKHHYGNEDTPPQSIDSNPVLTCHAPTPPGFLYRYELQLPG